MSEELEVLKIVTGRLERADIGYMVTGSMALNYYALPRMTRDIDLMVELSAQDAQRIVDLFREDFHVDGEAVSQAIERREAFNVIEMTRVVKADFVVRKESVYRRTEFMRKRRVSVDGHELFIVAPEDLVISKLDWARDTRSETQLGDVRSILTSVRDLDHAYLAEWIAHLGLDALYRGEPMKDTPPEIERRYRAMLLQRSAEERLLMGDSMYAAARALVRASILAGIPRASAAQLRQQIFLRFYGHEFDTHTRGRILAALDGEARSQQNAAAAR